MGMGEHPKSPEGYHWMGRPPWIGWHWPLYMGGFQPVLEPPKWLASPTRGVWILKLSKPPGTCLGMGRGVAGHHLPRQALN